LRLHPDKAEFLSHGLQGIELVVPGKLNASPLKPKSVQNEKSPALGPGSFKIMR
jgi:hypothetical protein